MHRRILSLSALALLAFACASAPSFASAQGKPPSSGCAKFSGTVLLTYHNPDTIIMHVIRGKVRRYDLHNDAFDLLYP